MTWERSVSTCNKAWDTVKVRLMTTATWIGSPSLGARSPRAAAGLLRLGTSQWPCGADLEQHSLAIGQCPVAAVHGAIVKACLNMTML